MDTLTARDNLLAADKDVERVSVLSIVRVGHGIEWASGNGKLVDDIVIGAVLFFHQLAYSDLIASTQVFVVRNQPSVFISPVRVAQHLHCVLEWNYGSLIEERNVL